MVQVESSIGSRERTFLQTKPWLDIVRQRPIISAEDDLLLIMATFPDTLQMFDRFKALPMSKRTASGFMQVWQSYQSLVDELTVQRRDAVFDGTFTYVSSHLLHPTADRHLLQLVPQTRRYRSQDGARYCITQTAAQMVLQLELSQLCGVALESGLEQDIRKLEQSSLWTYRGITAEHVLNAEHAIGVACEHATTIVESVEQFFLPGAGIMAAFWTAFPVVATTALLSAIGDPRVEYLQALQQRLEQRSGYSYGDVKVDHSVKRGTEEVVPLTVSPK